MKPIRCFLSQPPNGHRHEANVNRAYNDQPVDVVALGVHS
jgi:hypothetical protein